MVEIEWREDVRPNYEEAHYKVYGLRADHNGTRLEVRVLHTVEEGLHVAWAVGRPEGKLSAKGIVHLITPASLLNGPASFKDEVRMVEYARVVAKKRARLISEAWPKGLDSE